MERYIGKVLNDRYMITEVIGVGGMAYVYKAFDKICNRVVAVKILKDEFMSDTQFRRRFTNESKAITMLSQSNIVDVYDVSLEGEALYIVMEYIDGITLKEYMEKKGRLSDVEALHFIKQILKALAHAHERGIVHRDIKPHNIMLLKDGSIKITDFGIARLTKFDTQTISDMTIGSVHYISPEQASGDRTDARSDIYSVGIILYEMLTAKLPFEADTAVAVALKQVQDQPALPSDLCEDLPRGLEDITLKAMMKDPAIRYQSAGAFLADISMFEEDPTIVFDYNADSEDLFTPVADNSPTLTANLSLTEIEEEFEDDEDQLDEEEEEPSNFKKNWIPILAGVGSAFLIMMIVGLCIIFQKELGFISNKVSCPYVVGTLLDTAKEQHNFQFVVDSTVSSSEYDVGVIVSQKPAANTPIKKNSKITVVICGSSTKPTVTPDNNEDDEDRKEAVNYVPDVLKLNKTAAIAEFDRQGIAYKIISRNSDDVDNNCVISTYPNPGEEVFEDTVVIIYVSIGPKEQETELENVTMPDLTNLTLDAAKTTLKNNKLELGTVTEEYSDTVEAGKVISQSVDKDEEVEEGSSINLVISKGQEEDPSEEEPDPNNPTPPVDGSGETTEPTPETPVLKDASVPVTLTADPANPDKTVVVVATLPDGTVIYNQTVTPATTPQLLIPVTQQPVGTVITVTVDGVAGAPFTVS